MPASINEAVKQNRLAPLGVGNGGHDDNDDGDDDDDANRLRRHSGSFNDALRTVVAPLSARSSGSSSTRRRSATLTLPSMLEPSHSVSPSNSTSDLFYPRRVHEVDFDASGAPPHLYALHRAVWAGSMGAVRVALADPRVDVNERAAPADGATALYLAAQLGSSEIGRLLLKRGADPIMRTSIDGGTPLAIAAQRGHVAACSALIEFGGDAEWLQAAGAADDGGEQTSMPSRSQTAREGNGGGGGTRAGTPALVAASFNGGRLACLDRLLDAGAARCRRHLHCAIALAEANRQLSVLSRLLARAHDAHADTSPLVEHHTLRRLDLSKWNLLEMPTGLCNVTTLHSLDLSHNAIGVLPALVSQLTNLRSLNLAQNRINFLPASLGQLTQLCDLELKGNSLLQVPRELRKKPQRLLAHLRKKAAGVRWPFLRLMVLGAPDSGQRRLLRRWLPDDRKAAGGAGGPLTSPKPSRATSPKTARATSPKAARATSPPSASPLRDASASLSPSGAGSAADIEAVLNDTHVAPWRVSSELSFECWIFDRSAIRYRLYEFFLTDGAIYCLTFDLTKTIDAIAASVEFWLKKLKHRLSNVVPIVVVGTRLDRTTTEDAEQKLAAVARKFPRKVYPNLRGVFAVSSRHKETMKPFRDRLVSVARKHAIVRQMVPPSYLELMDTLRHFRDEGYDVIEVAALFARIRHETSLQEADDINAGIEFMSDAGHLVHFEDAAADVVLLRPERIMHRVIALRDRVLHNGILHHNDLATLWPRYVPELYAKILAILEKLGLAFACRSFSGAALGDSDATAKYAADQESGGGWQQPLRSQSRSPTRAHQQQQQNEQASDGDDQLSLRLSSHRAANESLATPQITNVPALFHSPFSSSHAVAVAGAASSSLSPSTPSPLRGNRRGRRPRSLSSGPQRTRTLFPSLLDEHAPQEVRAAWPALPGDDEIEYSRHYTYAYLPLGIFGRVLASMLHIADVVPLLMWATGFVAQMGDEQKAYAVLDPIRLNLRIAVRVTQGFEARMSRLSLASRAERQNCKSMLQELVQAVDTIIECYYTQMQTTVRRSIECTHCLQARDRFAEPYLFAYEQCLAAVRRSEPYVLCCGVPSRMVRLDRLAPDIALTHLPVLRKGLHRGKQIGEGGFGIVYCGTLRLKSAVLDVAIKTIKQEAGVDKSGSGHWNEAYEEFQREVYIMAAIDHRNLVRLYGVTVHPDISMVLEYMSEGDVYHFVHSDAPLSNALRLRICGDICRGMAYLHSLSPPIVHRDLRSPSM
jgi:Protein tyrosine and serine/threonine kinase/Ankyrin repeats (3 copies)/C-terminal of Roc, COR, domain/Leucine rich repeat